MSRLFKSSVSFAALAASVAGLLASAVPAAAAPAFDTLRVHDGMVSVAQHSRDEDWGDQDDDRYPDHYRDRYRDRDRYRGYYGRRAYYDEPVRADTRVWRARDGRYYCRKEDGTTGLVIGGVVGGLIGNEVAGGGDRTLGTILGVAGGALLGRAIDRSDARCR